MRSLLSSLLSPLPSPLSPPLSLPSLSFSHPTSQINSQVEIMAHLLHPNIVLLMGACLESHYGENNWAIITEFLPRGDLYIISCRFFCLSPFLLNFRYGIIHDSNISLSMSQKLQFAIDVASGMAWLQGAFEAMYSSCRKRARASTNDLASRFKTNECTR